MASKRFETERRAALKRLAKRPPVDMEAIARRHAANLKKKHAAQA